MAEPFSPSWLATLAIGLALISLIIIVAVSLTKQASGPSGPQGAAGDEVKNGAEQHGGRMLNADLDISAGGNFTQSVRDANLIILRGLALRPVTVTLVPAELGQAGVYTPESNKVAQNSTNLFMVLNRSNRGVTLLLPGIGGPASGKKDEQVILNPDEAIMGRSSPFGLTVVNYQR